MDSSAQKKESGTNPFADDLLAVQRPSWFKQLTAVSPDVREWDKLLRKLPLGYFDGLPQRLSESLANYLVLPEKKKIEFLFLVRREINAAESISTDKQNSLWFTLGVEGNDGKISFEMDRVFANWLIDAALGVEERSKGRDLRENTPSEIAVLEFLTRNIANEANKLFRAQILHFRSITVSVPDWLERKPIDEGDASSLLQFNYQTVHGLLPSIVKLYLSSETIRAFKPNNRSFARKRQDRFDSPIFQKRVKTVEMRLDLGGNALTVSEISALETGDVILLEDRGLSVKGVGLSGRVNLLVGSGNNSGIHGAIHRSGIGTSKKAGTIPGKRDGEKGSVKLIDFNRPLKIRIEKFFFSDNQALTKTIMSETEDKLNIDEKATSDAESSNEAKDKASEVKPNGLDMDNLNVNLRVELEARRLTLFEVGNLRENQVIELGIRPTDSVHLLIDNQTIGRGELVAVRDRLGVKITKLLR